MSKTQLRTLLGTAKFQSKRFFHTVNNHDFYWHFWEKTLAVTPVARGRSRAVMHKISLRWQRSVSFLYVPLETVIQFEVGCRIVSASPPTTCCQRRRGRRPATWTLRRALPLLVPTSKWLWTYDYVQLKKNGKQRPIAPLIFYIAGLPKISLF